MKPGPDADARGIAKGELMVSVVFLFMLQKTFTVTLNSRHVNYVTQVSNGWILTIIFINWLYKNIVRFIFIIK